MLEQLFFLAILGIIITLKQYTIYPAGWETKKTEQKGASLRSEKGRPSVPKNHLFTFWGLQCYNKIVFAQPITAEVMLMQLNHMDLDALCGFYEGGTGIGE